MSYTAKHYVKIAGRKYTPGEIIDIPIPEEKLKRLLRLKAIAPASSADLDPADDTAGSDEDGGKENVRDNYASQLDNLGYDPSGDPKEPQDEEEPTEEEPTEEETPTEEEPIEEEVPTEEEPVEEEPQPTEEENN